MAFPFQDCINEGAITGNRYVGGIAGGLSTGCTVTNCSSTGTVSGTSEVGGIAGRSNVNMGTQYDRGEPNAITGCTVSASVTGTTNVGGILGQNTVASNGEKEATSIQNNVLMPQASVNGESGTGAIIGDNSEMTTDTETIKNNFWPEAAGAAAGSGVGSSSDATESVINTANSPYGLDGALTTPVTGSDGESITNLGDALEEALGEGSIPDTLEVIVSYDRNGHGADVSSVTVTMGSQITLPNMPDDGYFAFTGWTSGGQSYAAGATVAVMQDTTFTA